MKLDPINVKVRKGTSEKVRGTIRHEDPRRKSRAADKRNWKREVRETVY